MKLFYLMVDGICKVENTRINARNVEMPDGPHPKTNDSVWHDSQRMRPPVMIIIEGVLAPYGASMAAQDVKTIMLEVKLASLAFKSPSLSKMWHRAFERFMGYAVKYFVPVCIIALIGWAVYNQLTGGP